MEIALKGVFVFCLLSAVACGSGEDTVALPAQTASVERSGAHCQSDWVLLGKTEVKGFLDEEEVRREICRHLPDLERCYQQKRSSAQTKGEIEIKFTIGQGGRAVAVSVGRSSLKEEALGQCLANRFREWTFPELRGGAIAICQQTFTLGPR